MSQKVQVLVIDHRHGRNITVHASLADARASLAGYCEEWWEDAHRRGAPMRAPKDNEKLIGRYFAAMAESEGYEIAECTLADSDEKDG